MQFSARKFARSCSQFKEGESSANQEEVNKALKSLYEQGKVSDPGAKTGVMLTAGIQEKDQRAEDSLRAALSKAPTTPMKILALTSASELSQSDAVAALERMRGKQEIVEVSGKGFLLSENEEVWRESIEKTAEEAGKRGVKAIKAVFEESPAVPLKAEELLKKSSGGGNCQRQGATQASERHAAARFFVNGDQSL